MSTLDKFFDHLDGLARRAEEITDADPEVVEAEVASLQASLEEKRKELEAKQRDATTKREEIGILAADLEAESDPLSVGARGILQYMDEINTLLERTLAARGNN